MKGTSVEGTVPDLFEGRMLVSSAKYFIEGLLVKFRAPSVPTFPIFLQF